MNKPVLIGIGLTLLIHFMIEKVNRLSKSTNTSILGRFFLIFIR